MMKDFLKLLLFQSRSTSSYWWQVWKLTGNNLEVQGLVPCNLFNKYIKWEWNAAYDLQVIFIRLKSDTNYFLKNNGHKVLSKGMTQNVMPVKSELLTCCLYAYYINSHNSVMANTITSKYTNSYEITDQTVQCLPRPTNA